MSKVVAFALTICLILLPGRLLAQDSTNALVGTWKLTSWLTKFDGGDTVQPYGAYPKGRFLITADGHWFVILTAANRAPAKTLEQKAALLDTMLAYAGRYTIDGDKISIRVEMSSNEIYTGANQIQTRFFSVQRDMLTLRTGLIASAIRPGQKAEGILTLERELPR